MEHKWYVDEVYIALIRSPLWILGKIFALFDKFIIDGAMVNGIAAIPRVVAKWFSPLHNGAVQSYGVSMIGGAILIALLMLYLPEIVELLQSMNQQNGTEHAVTMLGGGQ
jgi:NADH-quinone oxidoreductase subunit L